MIIIVDPGTRIINCDRCKGTGEEPTIITTFTSRCAKCRGRGCFVT